MASNSFVGGVHIGRHSFKVVNISVAAAAVLADGLDDAVGVYGLEHFSLAASIRTGPVGCIEWWESTYALGSSVPTVTEGRSGVKRK